MAHDVIDRHADIRRDLELRILINESAGFNCMLIRALLRKGFFAPGPSKEFNDGELMRAGYCFGNAAELVIKNPELSYAEGYGYVPEFKTFFHHGWAMDGDTVIDPTWEEAYAATYIGFRWTHDQMARRILFNDGVPGMLAKKPGRADYLDLAVLYEQDPEGLANELRPARKWPRQIPIHGIL